MRIKRFLTVNWYRIIYIVAGSLYIHALKKLNRVLLSKSFSNDISLLQYNGYQALKFFFLAVFFIITACMMIAVCMLKEVKKYDDFWDIVYSFIAMVAIAVLGIMILINISVPILRAIAGVCAAVAGLVYAVTQ